MKEEKGDRLIFLTENKSVPFFLFHCTVAFAPISFIPGLPAS